MGGGQRWPNLEKAHRSHKHDCPEKARCEAEKSSYETKLTEATSNMHLSSPQPTYMPIFSEILANRAAAVTDSDSRGTENDAMDADSAVHLLINNGINPSVLTLSQIESFRAQDPDTQLLYMQIYKDNLARMAYLQRPRSTAPVRDTTRPNGGLDDQPSDFIYSQAPSPYKSPKNKEAEMAYQTTMQERHLQHHGFMAGRMQELLLAAQALPREGPSIIGQAHKNAVATAQPAIGSQTPLELHGSSYESKAPRDDRPSANIGHHPSAQASHALLDYEMQLMLLDQQNQKRLLMARQHQEPISRRVSQQK